MSFSFLMEQPLNGSSGNHQYRLAHVHLHLWFEIYCVMIFHVFTINHLICLNVLRSSKKLGVFRLFVMVLSLLILLVFKYSYLQWLYSDALFRCGRVDQNVMPYLILQRVLHAGVVVG